MSHEIKTIKGPRKVIEQWLTDLRSGKYKQAKGQLKRTLPDGSSGYCCLGVLIETNTPDYCLLDDGVLPSGWWLDSQHLQFSNLTNQHIGLECKGDSTVPTVWYDERWVSVADLNDGERIAKSLSFSEIADLIENHVEYTD